MRRRHARRTQAIAVGVVAVVAAAVAMAAYGTGLFDSIELDTVDARFSVRGAQEAPEHLVVVAIDDKTFSDLDQQWPFPRSLHGRVIDRLRKAGARTVAYDIQFTEPSVPREDNALIAAVGRNPGTILSTTEVNESGDTNVFGGEDVLRQFDARAANTYLDPDSDGVIRKVAYEEDKLVTFSVAGAEEATGEPVDPATFDEDGETWIDFRGPPGTIRTVSFSDTLRGRVPDSVFRDSVVVIGAVAPSLQDVHPTSVSGEELMSGPELQANAIWTVQEGNPLNASGAALSIVLIAFFAAAAAAATLRLSPAPAFLGALLVGGLYLLVAQLAFNSDLVLPVVHPLMALILAAIGAMAVNYVLTAFERQRVHDTFARFVPEAVVEEVLQRTDDDLRLGGVRRQCTVLFTDLRGFTSFSEAMEPRRVIEVLNVYLGEMSDEIMDQGGTLAAYMGDGIMAVFGAPIEQSDHADRAIRAAREMLRVRLPRFCAWMREQGLGDGFAMGIGLMSGPVMSGQVGSERRIEYTAIGDTTNTASRLEGMTKGTPHQVFISSTTKAMLRDEHEDLVFVDDMDIRGREAKIGIWTLEEPPEPPPAAEEMEQPAAADAEPDLA